MKKGLIKEAFRLQQLAGLSPINEVFEEEHGIGLEEESEAPNVKDKLRKVYKGLAEFRDLKQSGGITDEEYDPILQAVLKVYDRLRKEEENEDNGINEELDIDDIELDSDFENPNTSKMGTQRPTLSVAYLKLKDGTELSGEELAKLNMDQDFLHDIANSMKDPSDLGENDMPQKKSLDTKNISNIEFDDVDHRDAPDYSDAFVSYAEWKDTGEPLTDEELDQLNDDFDFVHDALYDYLY